MQQQKERVGEAAGSRGAGALAAGAGASQTAGSQTSSEEFESEEQEFSDMTGTSELEDMSWVEWFCTLKGNELFVVVDDDFIRDDFNLTGLASQVPLFDEALDIVLDNEQSEDEDDEEEQRKSAMAEQAAELLYGLVHARFLATARGLQLLQQKYAQKQFGVCPNSACEGWALLPTALTDTPNKHTAKVYCAKCCELYHPPKGSRLNHLDGAYFGTSIAQIFHMQFPFLLPTARSSTVSPPPYYVPTVYGFKVSPQVKTRLRVQQVPRMIHQARQRAEEEREALLGSPAAAAAAAGISSAADAAAQAAAAGEAGRR
ncbi:ck2 beta subunit [Toxoplasma gondii VEG]|uniref:Casein kinase II subunit beta n=4 Tax=Toxoplasma gondii TaxID=5811 RepID=B9Q595_TOXGV|nr:ck2 beta subunit [Toxoplasma gondii VEG]KFG52451.1 ck2 beta subunit [Toxoplasma gondii p89]PUA87701.1 ck2 beta subunit [Toxoplasma gondii TgCATBr9]CEL75458.1 TPA: casein kinase II beta chain, putative [Toxoplasma gondii VEG]